MKAYIVSKLNCAFCIKAKKLLREHNIDYDEDIVDYSITKEELLKKAPHAQSVPQIWLDDNYVGTFEDLQKKLLH
jgi:glutaredoxin